MCAEISTPLHTVNLPDKVFWDKDEYDVSDNLAIRSDNVTGLIDKQTSLLAYC